MYFFCSGVIEVPSKRTSSPSITLKPISVITLPLTVTLPEAIYLSASLLEETPEFEMYLFKRIPSAGSACGVALIFLYSFFFFPWKSLLSPLCRPLDESLLALIIINFRQRYC
jgi:hypothetical protein